MDTNTRGPHRDAVGVGGKLRVSHNRASASFVEKTRKAETLLCASILGVVADSPACHFNFVRYIGQFVEA